MIGITLLKRRKTRVAKMALIGSSPQKKRKRSSKKKARGRTRAGRATRRKRPYRLDKLARAARRHRKRRKGRHATGHHKRMLDEVVLLNRVLEQLALVQKPDLDRRHYRNDPEYAFSDKRMQGFKRGFPNPDVSMLRPQGAHALPHRGNFPGYNHPHEVHEF